MFRGKSKRKSAERESWLIFLNNNRKFHKMSFPHFYNRSSSVRIDKGGWGDEGEKFCCFTPIDTHSLTKLDVLENKLSASILILLLFNRLHESRECGGGREEEKKFRKINFLLRLDWFLVLCLPIPSIIRVITHVCGVVGCGLKRLRTWRKSCKKVFLSVFFRIVN